MKVSEFPTETLTGYENEEERSATERSFIFGIFKFFLNQQITANFPKSGSPLAQPPEKRAAIRTTFLRETKPAQHKIGTT